MGRSRESGVAAASASTVSHHEAIAGLGEIVQQVARRRVVHDGSDRSGHVHAFSVAAFPVAALAVTAALGLMLGVEAEMQQRVVMFAGNQDDVAAAASVAAAGPASRNILLAPERKTAVAAVSGFDRNGDVVDEHRCGTGSGLLRRADADEFAQPAAIAEFDHSTDLGEQGVVLAHAHIEAGLDAGAAL